MKIDLHGEVVIMVSGERLSIEGKPVYLAQVLITALGMVFQNENPSGDEKFRRGVLAGRIKEAFLKDGEMEFSEEEVKLLKYVVGKAYSPFVVYAVWNLLDGKEVSNEKRNQENG